MDRRTHLPMRAALHVALLLLLLWPALLLAQPKLSVELEGVSGDAEANVRAYLGLLTSPPASEDHLRRAFSQAPAEIRRALEALGYYRPEITPTLEHEGEAWVARFRIDPGAPVRVTRMVVTVNGPGGEDAAFTGLLGKLPLKEGDVLNHARYEAAKKALESVALERGYFDGRYAQSRAQVDSERRGAVVTLTFESGPRYRFGAVTFEQQGLRDAFLARFLNFKAGDPYLAERITALQTDLVNSDYFDEVDVRVEPEQAQGLEVPVTVRLSLRKRMRYTLGVGYGTDTGPRASAGWENRRVRQNGERLRTLLELSGIRSAFTAAYEIPLSKPLTDQLVLQGSVVDESTDSADSRSVLLSAKRVESLGQGWVRNVSLNYLRELSTVGEVRDDFQLLYPAVSWTRVKADDRMTPRRGERYSLEVKGSDPALGSDARFMQARLDAKLIRAFTEDYRVLLRGSLGTTLVEDVQRLPASLRFFAGGDQSVRGYDYNALGPVDDNGDVVGGRVLAVGSVELERRLFGKWRAAVFYDVGNAVNDWGQPLKQGVGVGVRWLSPVGPIRVDLAVAVDEPGRPLRLHVNMGPDL